MKAHDQASVHPLRHTSMVCIDLVAKLHGGGAWNLDMNFTNCAVGEFRTVKETEGHTGKNESRKIQKRCNHSWITGDKGGSTTVDCGRSRKAGTEDGESLKELDSENLNLVEPSFPCLVTENESMVETDDLKTFVEDTPYLCSGYDLYITREPCTM